jgi:hypothetical protein
MRKPPYYGYVEPNSNMDRRNNGYRFDKSINLGNIISMVALLITLFGFGMKILERMDSMETKVNLMWEQFSITLKNNIKN